jgi:hypothetical protein
MSPYRFLANYLRSRYDRVWLDRPDSPWTTLLPGRMIVPLRRDEPPPPPDELLLVHESLPADQLPPGRIPGLNLWRYRYAESEEAVAHYLAYLVRAWVDERKAADERQNILLMGFGTVGRVLYSDLATDARLAAEGYQFAVTDNEVGRWQHHPDFVHPDQADYSKSLCVITPWQANGMPDRLRDLGLQPQRDWIACPFWRPALLEAIGPQVLAVPWVARHIGQCALEEGALHFAGTNGGPAVPLRFLARGTRYCGPRQWILLRSVGQLTPFVAPGGVRFALPAGYDASYESGAVYLGDREDAFVEHAVLGELAEVLDWPKAVRESWRELFTTSLTGLTPALSHEPIRGTLSDLERLVLVLVALRAGLTGGDLLEAGMLAGDSTYHLALGWKIADAPGRLWSANRWLQGQAAATSLLAGTQMSGYVNHLAPDALEAGLPGGLAAGTIVLHGHRDYAATSHDLLKLLPMLATDGLVVVCGFGPETPGVMCAVREQFYQSRLRPLAQLDKLIILQPHPQR